MSKYCAQPRNHVRNHNLRLLPDTKVFGVELVPTNCLKLAVFPFRQQGLVLAKIGPGLGVGCLKTAFWNQNSLAVGDLIRKQDPSRGVSPNTVR